MKSQQEYIEPNSCRTASLEFISPITEYASLSTTILVHPNCTAIANPSAIARSADNSTFKPARVCVCKASFEVLHAGNHKVTTRVLSIILSRDFK